MIGDKTDWKVRLTLAVGEKGTAHEYEKYGDSLICIRYRYNEKKGIRIKTVELIEDKTIWKPKKKIKPKLIKRRKEGVNGL